MQLASDSLTIAESLRLVSCVATSMLHFFTAVCSFYLERQNKQPPIFALIFFIVGWCTITLGSGTSGLGRHFPILLIGAPFLSGYMGPAIFIYTKRLTTPHERVSLKWLFLGMFGTCHSILALIIPNGLDPVIQSILHKEPYVHPLLSPIMLVHGIQLVSFIVLSTFLITKAYIAKTQPDLRQTQFWLLIICWTGSVIIVFTNILPTFRVIMTEIQPAVITFPFAIVGGLSIKAFAEESTKYLQSRIQQREVRMDSLGRLARGMAHDLNNVLSTILGHAEMAKLKTQHNSTTLSHLNQVILGSNRASLLIERMLTYSGKRYQDADAIDPRQRIVSLFNSVATLQPESVAMQIEISAKLPKIRFDEAELDSTILNLLQNGIQALPKKKGRIILRVLQEKNTQLPSDFIGTSLNGLSTLRIEVEDTGRGMTEEEASRALEPFFSTHATGKGLGLVNVLSAVKGAGGAIWFQSTLKIGTRFIFWIPAAKAIEVTSVLNHFKDISTLKILIVEDDPEVANVLIEMLMSLGSSPQYNMQGEEIMESLHKNSLSEFDIAILDIRLDGIDGIELGHHLLSEEKAKKLLFISGDEPGQRLKQFQSNQILFIRKPIGLGQLEGAIQELSIVEKK